MSGAQIFTVVPVLVLLLLETPALFFGLPRFIPLADEALVIESAVSTFGGDWSPFDFRYPTAFAYLLRFCLEPLVLWLRLSGKITSTSDLFAYFTVHPTAFYVIGRALSLASACATVLLTGALARRAAGPPVAALATIALLLTPAFVDLSHEARVDALSTMWIVSALLFAVRYYERGRSREAVLCAISCGLALGTKYSALPAWLLLGLVSLVSGSRLEPVPIGSRVLRLALLIAIASATFIATNPFAVIDWKEWLEGTRRIAGLTMKPFGPNTQPGYRLYPRLLAGEAFGAGFALALVAGISSFLKSPRPLRNSLLLFTAPYLVIILLSKTAYERFLLPLIPAFAIIVALGCVAIARRLRRRESTALLLLGLLFLPAAATWLARIVIPIAGADTRLQALDLVEQRLPQGGTIVVTCGERGVPPFLKVGEPPFASLHWLNVGAGLTRSEYERAEAKVASLRVADGRPTYRVVPSSREEWIPPEEGRLPDAVILCEKEPANIPPRIEALYEEAIAFTAGRLREGRSMTVLIGPR